MGITDVKTFIEDLKSEVTNHSIFKHRWFLQKKNLEDILFWLSQEYFVSIEFIDWFLVSAALTPKQSYKIILVENIWEELGEGNLENTHVEILKKFLSDLKIDLSSLQVLQQTSLYLEKMKNLVKKSFGHSLGALGPANEFLLKLEYFQVSKMYEACSSLNFSHQPLPKPSFFQVNLDADQTHAKRLFDLIALESKNNSEFVAAVKEGNRDALQFRELFYEGLCENSNPYRLL